MNRYFIGFLVSVGLIVLLIVLLFSGGKSPLPKPTGPGFTSYVYGNTAVKETIIGPVTADQTHNSLTITVTQSSATYDLIQGYNNNVVASKSYNNNLNSYKAFLYSLYYDGFNKGSNSVDLSNDEGYCSVGDRYIFELIKDGNDVQRFWETNCASTPKTYDGNLISTLQLFKAQIPDYDLLTENANIQT